MRISDWSSDVFSSDLSVVTATGQERLAFFDAIAPIVHRDSIDMDVCWIQSRWDKTTEASNEGGDYINSPLNKEQYLAFHQGLLDGEKTEFREWEKDTPDRKSTRLNSSH